jgi:hypothetical protein
MTLYAKWMAASPILSDYSVSTAYDNASLINNQRYKYYYFMVEDVNDPEMRFSADKSDVYFYVDNLTTGEDVSAYTYYQGINLISPTKSIPCSKGDIIKITIVNNSNNVPHVNIYFSGFSNMTSTAVAESTFTSTVHYGDTIDFGTPAKEGQTFAGWLDENIVQYTSETYDVEDDLVLTALFV